jgi:hypothetical protein
MSNRILHLALTDHGLTPAQAEVRLAVTPERLTPATEVRGRLMGPRCRFSSTVEVAYHFRPLPGAAPDQLHLRAIIPEPSLWDPTSPFLYEGPIELWQDGALCHSLRIRRGLRTLAVGAGGLRWNGRPLHLCGRSVDRLDEEPALALRSAGCNLLLVPMRADTAGVWDLADSAGFLVLGRLGASVAPAQLAGCAAHPCHLGWLVRQGSFPGRPPGGIVGLEAADLRSPLSRSEGDFLACSASGSADALATGWPVLVLGPGLAVTPPPSLLGQVE